MIILITGNGKGKTTSSVGQIIRALGHNHKVCLIQLFKGEDFYGEQKILSGLSGLDFFSFAKKHPFCFKDVSEEQVAGECRQAMEKVYEIAEDCRYNLIVLEEFNIAVRDGFVKKEDLIAVSRKLSQKANVMITGRGACGELVEAADLVSDVQEIKHPYSKGIPAQEGIEF